jgi:hypothetical protein
MKWFKSLWFKMRKSNNLPGNEVLIPMKEITLSDLPIGSKITVETVPKRKYTRKKKEVQNETTPTNT